MARNTDWAQPGTGTLYTKVLTDLKDLAFMGSTMMHSDDDPTIGPEMTSAATEGSIKWSTTNNRFEIFRSGWKELRDTTNSDPDVKEKYNINVSMLGGYLSSSYRNIANMDAGFLSPLRFNDTSHGIITSETAHSLSSATLNGFMSKAQYTKLSGLVNRTDVDIATAYNSETYTLTASNLTVDSSAVKKITGAALDSFIEAKLASGVYAVTFKPVYSSGTALIDVKRGQYQELVVSTNTSITFQEYLNNPYTMYLYIKTGGAEVTVPTGLNHRWSGGIPTATINNGTGGVDLLTVNYDGKGNFYYMLLADMKGVP